MVERFLVVWVMAAIVGVALAVMWWAVSNPGVNPDFIVKSGKSSNELDRNQDGGA
jgi:hypothetical protein